MGDDVQVLSWSPRTSISRQENFAIPTFDFLCTMLESGTIPACLPVPGSFDQRHAAQASPTAIDR